MLFGVFGIWNEYTRPFKSSRPKENVWYQTYFYWEGDRRMKKKIRSVVIDWVLNNIGLDLPPSSLPNNWYHNQQCSSLHWLMPYNTRHYTCLDNNKFLTPNMPLRNFSELGYVFFSWIILLPITPRDQVLVSRSVRNLECSQSKEFPFLLECIV